MRIEHHTQLAPRARSLGRLTQRIADEIGEAIVTGRIGPDELLPIESELIVEYGASRSVLREAIKVLNAKGLVTAKPRRGTTVQPITEWNLFDPDVLRWVLARDFSIDILIQFTQVRIGFEPQAAVLACEAASRAEIDAIGEGYQRMVEADRGDGDPLAADIAFHLAILDATHNLFFQQLKSLVEAALNFSIRYTDSIVRDEREKLISHERLYLAIAERNRDVAYRRAFVLLSDVLALMTSRPALR